MQVWLAVTRDGDDAVDMFDVFSSPVQAFNRVEAFAADKGIDVASDDVDAGWDPASEKVAWFTHDQNGIEARVEGPFDVL